MEERSARKWRWLATRGVALGGVAIVAPAWDEVAWLKAPSVMMPLGLGSAVAASREGTVAVGGGRDADLGLDAGAVAIWHCSDRGVSMPSVIRHPMDDRHAWFGGALALEASGSILAIGAPHEMGARDRSHGGWPGGFQSGSVRLYRRAPPGEDSAITGKGRSGWEVVALLRSKDPRSGATFGAAVAIDGARLLVGSPGHSGSGFAAGLAEVFVSAPGGWRHEAALAPPTQGAAMGLRSGSSVALMGATAAVGAPGASLGSAASGCVDVYRLGKDGWRHSTRLTSPSPQLGGSFGAALALGTASDLLAVGAPLESDSSGAVYLYRCIDIGLPSERWEHASTIVSPPSSCPDSPPHPEAFGMSLAMTGKLLVVGASESCAAAGSVYTVQVDPDGTTAVESCLTASHAAPDFHDGYRVALGADEFGNPMAVAGRLGSSDLAPGPGGATFFVRASQGAVAAGP